MLDIVILDTYLLMMMQSQKFNIKLRGQKMFQYLKFKVSLMKRLKQTNQNIQHQLVVIWLSPKFMKNQDTLNLWGWFLTKHLKQTNQNILNQLAQCLTKHLNQRNQSTLHQ